MQSRVFLLAAFCLGSMVFAQVKEAPPAIGVNSMFASAAGLRAIAGLGTWEDRDGRLGGGSWRIDYESTTPYGCGPDQTKVHAARIWSRLGPRLQLRQGNHQVCFPLESDGDVRATLIWLGKPVPDDVRGEPGVGWQITRQIVDNLGPVADGLRASAFVADYKPTVDKPTVVQVVIWNCSAERVVRLGSPAVLWDGVRLPVEVRWPPKDAAEVDTKGNFVALDPGFVFEGQFDLREIASSPSSADLLRPGPHQLEFEWTMEPTKTKPNPAPLVSRRTETVVPPPKAAPVPAGEGKNEPATGGR